MSPPDFIESYDDVLSVEECQALIARFERDPRVALGQTGAGLDRTKKDSRDLVITRQADWRDPVQMITMRLMERLVDYFDRYRFMVMGALATTLAHPESGVPTELRLENFEQLCTRQRLDALLRALYRCGQINLQHYAAGSGGYHHWHSEIFPKDPQCEQLHRVLLWIIYLNDVTEGGETEFFYQGRKVSPRAGRLVVAPAGFTHTHKGHVPRSNDKYILASWVMYQRAEQLFQR